MYLYKLVKWKWLLQKNFGSLRPTKKVCSYSKSQLIGHLINGLALLCFCLFLEIDTQEFNIIFVGTAGSIAMHVSSIE